MGEIAFDPSDYSFAALVLVLLDTALSKQGALSTNCKSGAEYLRTGDMYGVLHTTAFHTSSSTTQQHTPAELCNHSKSCADPDFVGYSSHLWKRSRPSYQRCAEVSKPTVLDSRVLQTPRYPSVGLHILFHDAIQGEFTTISKSVKILRSLQVQARQLLDRVVFFMLFPHVKLLRVLFLMLAL
jgi:hypothetical protein